MGGVVISSLDVSNLDDVRIYKAELHRRWEKIPEDLRAGSLHKKFPEMAEAIDRWMSTIPRAQRSQRAYGLSTRGNGHWEISVKCGHRRLTFKDGEVVRVS